MQEMGTYNAKNGYFQLKMNNPAKNWQFQSEVFKSNAIYGHI
jgi:hypothetical protein